MLRLSTSSWSLDATLGSPRYADAPTGDSLVNKADNSAAEFALALLDLPARLAEHGITTLELCHFHLPARDGGYLDKLRSALDAAGVELFSILIDSGDITQDDGVAREADVRFIRRWLDVASQLGATHARVDAGRNEPTDEIIARSADHLAALADYAASIHVRVITENWHETSRQAEPLLEILRRCSDRVGLCVDFGNAELSHADKYATLNALLPHATSIHAKPRVDDAGRIDRDELLQCMNMAVAAGFAGPVSLINSNRDNEWAGLDELRDALMAYISQSA
ncbi:MAG: sugar phosphate isomerase/epimerase family protein [Phycisphaeraceae bacterium]